MNVPARVAERVAKAAESLDAARDLRAGGHHGFAAARGYYAMFYAAEATLLHKGLQFKKHSAVHSHFNKIFVKTRIFPQSTFKALQAAFQVRTKGDYGASPVAEDQVERTIHDAEEFVAAVSKYLRGEGYELGGP
jgi:uncharacterized protein (UPF0332 family)